MIIGLIPEVGAPAIITALVVMIASTVVFARVLVEIAAVAAGSFAVLAPPLAAMRGVAVAISAAVWFAGRKEDPELPEASNPAERKAALAFGALYDVVLLAVAFARDRFGTAGLYTVAGVPAPAALPQAIGPSGAYRGMRLWRWPG